LQIFDLWDNYLFICKILAHVNQFIYHLIYFLDYCSCGHHLYVIFNQLSFLVIKIDRGAVPDLSMSGDKSDLVVVDPHDPTTTSKTRSVNAIAKPTPDGY
jgi:hypothetical protein